VVSLYQLLKTLVERGGTELFLVRNSAPQIRIDGLLVPLDMPVLTTGQILDFLTRGLSERLSLDVQQLDRVVHTWVVDELGRFKLTSLLDHVKRPLVVIRHYPEEFTSFRELGLPEAVSDIAPGLHLIGGLARSGRSTVLNAVVDYYNRTSHGAILVLSADLHVQHHHKSSIVTVARTHGEMLALLQSGSMTSFDTVAFDDSYDLEAVSTALDLCLRGLPVFLVWFGRNATDVIRNVVNTFPAQEQPGALGRLAKSLQWVTALVTNPKINGRGLHLVTEFLSATPDVRQMITAGRYDNPEKILTKDDPYSPHQ